ncbi:MAG TPA: type II toxin-antitoxin system HicA family toxin [Tepidiformaceae bacterium]
MSRLPAVRFTEVDRALRRLGFAVSRQRGSHVSYRHADGRGTTVPNHGSKDIALPLLREILREAELTDDEFTAAIRG